MDVCLADGLTVGFWIVDGRADFRSARLICVSHLPPTWALGVVTRGPLDPWVTPRLVRNNATAATESHSVARCRVGLFS